MCPVSLPLPSSPFASFPPGTGGPAKPSRSVLTLKRRSLNSSPHPRLLMPTVGSSAIPSLQPNATTYTAKRGDSIPLVARQYLKKTSYLTSSQLSDAIRDVNGHRGNNILKAGETLIIPGMLEAPIVEKTVAVPKDFEVGRCT